MPRRNNIHPANKKKLRSQREKILEWLLSGKTINTLQAILNFGCTRISARIYEIRDMGHVIESKPVQVLGGKVVAQYRLIKYKTEGSVDC